MAKCPNSSCKTEWVWDWCQDVWRDKATGKDCNERELLDERNEDGEAVSVILCQCSQCGAMLGFNTLDPTFGAPTFYRDEWKDIDWEQEEHSWREDDC